MVVVELAGVEERVEVAVALRRVVPVVLVSRDRVQTKPTIRGHIDRQRVVVTHKDRPTEALRQQLRRHCTVPGPQGFGVLDWHVRVEANFGARARAAVVVQAAGAELRVTQIPWVGGFGVLVVFVSVQELMELQTVTQSPVDPSAALSGLEVLHGIELIPALVSPAFTPRTSFAGRSKSIILVPAQVLFDELLPGVFAVLVRHPGWLRPHLLCQELVQFLAIRGTCRVQGTLRG